MYQQLKVHFFLWGVCVCIHVCVRACHWPDLGAGGWLSVDQLLMAKIKATFRVYFLKNITTGKVVNGIIFGHFCFVLFFCCFNSLIFPTFYLWKDDTTITREGSATDHKFSVVFVIKTKALVWDFHVMFFKKYLVLSHMHIFNLRTFPTVEMVRLALCSVVFLCSMLECVISTFIVLYLKTVFY